MYRYRPATVYIENPSAEDPPSKTPQPFVIPKQTIKLFTRIGKRNIQHVDGIL